MPLLAIIHIGDGSDDIRESNLPPGHTLVALYDFPKRSELTCAGTCVRKNSGAWTRDPRGFMKCAVCGSRNKRLRQWFTKAMFDWFGANLIAPENTVALFRTPEGYGPRDH